MLLLIFITSLLNWYFRHFLEQQSDAMVASAHATNAAAVQDRYHAAVESKFLFAIVRNPWSRLLSAYIEKFLYSTEYIHVCRVKTDWPQLQK